MSPEQLELAKRLCAHPKWRWVAGMLLHGGNRLLWLDDEYGAWHGSKGWAPDEPDEPMRPPDLADEATAAILLRMAIENGMDVNDGSQFGRWIAGPSLPQWTFQPDDPGTVAATALLEAWGE